jgi:hypothetical protein
LNYPYLLESGLEPIEVTITGKPRIVPAGPRVIKIKDRHGRRVVEQVVGYVRQPFIELVTDPGGTRNLDPRIIGLR